MKIKICGITTLQDALAAIEAGADMLGYNFYPRSKRYITPEACAEIQNELARRNLAVVAVGVFVNASRQHILHTMTRCNLGYAQLSGDENPDFLARLSAPSFKAIRPLPSADPLPQASPFARPTAPALLVDAHRPGQYGGTGHLADWEAAAALAARYPLLLAGGLTPENVRAAVERVQPWGVDVASGVETSPGRKDAGKMRRFVEGVRSKE